MNAPIVLRIASVLLNYRRPVEWGSTVKMPWCLQGDARRVTDSAAHLIEQHGRDGFTFPLQELRFAAEKLKREIGS